MYAIIEPVPAYPAPATTLRISDAQVIPGKSAFYQWTLLDSNGLTVGQNSINLTGDAYAAWGSDDDYLYTYTATALGLTIVAIVPDEPPAPPAPEPTPEPAPTEEPAPVVDEPAAPVAPFAEEESP